jgi:hypothetical protein
MGGQSLVKVWDSSNPISIPIKGESARLLKRLKSFIDFSPPPAKRERRRAFGAPKALLLSLLAYRVP